MDPVQRTLEVERITNLVRGFGWEKMEEVVEGNRLRLVIEKTIPETPPAPPE